MTDIAIRVENLSKRYRIGAREKRANTLRETLGNLAASPFDYLRRTLRGPTEEEIIWALKDVSFEACPEPVEGSSAVKWWAFLRLRSGQALGATGLRREQHGEPVEASAERRGRRRCSRSSPASPSRRRGGR
jgi:hypothetical protein